MELRYTVQNMLMGTTSLAVLAARGVCNCLFPFVYTSADLSVRFLSGRIKGAFSQPER